MTDATSKTDCLERARMHDQLASATDDAPARAMHQAMAAEYRRRASDLGDEPMMLRAEGPVLEMVATLA